MLNLQLIEEYCKAWNLNCKKTIKGIVKYRYSMYDAYNEIFRGRRKYQWFIWYIKYKIYLYLNLFVYNFVNKTRRIING